MDKYAVKLMSRALRDLDGIYRVDEKTQTVIVVTVRYSASQF